MLDVNQAVLAERVHARGTDPGAKFLRALGFANHVINSDVALRVYLVRVDAEFGFDVDWHFILFHL